ncbi:MAG: phosphoribosylaminoimidazolesuccinocarboxamide synthase [Pseudomonadota bacterium]|jgi:phosphoribosylaminoimidazole-succinocarboxamide synthase
MAVGSKVANVPPALGETNFDWLGPVYRGKVRDSYLTGTKRVLIATDRLSAFDRIISTIPGKGQVLTGMAAYWFGQSKDIVANHLVGVPDPSVMVVKDVSIIPIEVVVRGFLAGSAWRDYEAGRLVSGHRIGPGMSQFEQLPAPLVTPFTKEAVGKHDMPISESELLARGLVGREQWEEIRAAALRLFELGTKEVASRGLLFADTKYEFGLLNGQIVLADEIHTLDSSRFWVKASYENNLSAGEPPEMLDKEPIRRWLIERGFMGEGQPPAIEDDYRMALRAHYARSAEHITGGSFSFDDTEPNERIARNVRAFLASNPE